MSENVERCCACDDPTGKAGVGDGSLFTDSGHGPFCDSCYEGARWADAELTRLRKELAEKEGQLCGARDVLRKMVDAVKQEPAMQNMKYDALGAEALDVLFRSAACTHEARLRDWERSSAESGTVLVRNERYNELLAVEARVEDVEKTGEIIYKASNTFQTDESIRWPNNWKDMWPNYIALALRDYLKGGGG